VVHLADNNPCNLPQFSASPHFVSSDRLVAKSPTATGVLGTAGFRAGPKGLTFYDSDCRAQDSWNTSEDWGIQDASPERGLLLVSELHGLFRQLLVDPFARKMLKSGARGEARGFWLADNGAVTCDGNVCWDTATGTKVAQSPVPGNAGSASHFAAHSTGIVIDDFHDPGIPLSGFFTEMMARRRVWDFRSNKEIVSWPLKFITYSSSFDLDGYNRDRRPIPCAISPDGEFVVEGADGTIWLSRIKS